jgi:hypothetical protein
VELQNASGDPKYILINRLFSGTNIERKTIVYGTGKHSRDSYDPAAQLVFVAFVLPLYGSGAVSFSFWPSIKVKDDRESCSMKAPSLCFGEALLTETKVESGDISKQKRNLCQLQVTGMT